MKTSACENIIIQQSFAIFISNDLTVVLSNNDKNIQITSPLGKLYKRSKELSGHPREQKTSPLHVPKMQNSYANVLSYLALINSNISTQYT